MKKQSVLALLLGLTLLCTAVIPSVFAADGDSSDNGMVISKTAKANTDGTYTIQLEAYATGSKIISEVTEDVPTDIVLVLDQSGSMANNFSTVTVESYPESSGTNATFYANQDDLYYQLDDGGYVKVTVTREEIGVTYQYNEVPYYYKINSKLKEYADNNNLYYQVDGNYRPVTVEVIDNWPTSYTYKYTDENGSHEIESVNSFRWPRDTYYTKETVTVYKYTYSYTVGGETIVIESSEGNTNTPTEKFYRKTTTTQNLTCLDALKNAVTTFADNVAQKAAGADGILGTKDDVNHRVAVVGYASRADSNDPWINTEVFIGANQYNYNVDAKDYYGSAFQNMNTPQGQANVTASIGALDGNGATYTNYGLEMANGILNANPVQNGEKRNRVIILFTDGYPGKNADDFNQTAADAALTQAETAKDNGVSVYAVGIFSGADATTPGDKNGTNTQAANWFMQQVCSNNGTPQDPSYYLSAADADTLNNIFQQISNQIESGGSSTTLSSETVIKDIIAPAFTLPEGTTADNITLETYHCTGKSDDEYTWSKNSDAMGATAKVDGDQVSVTGFDFAENYVGPITENGNVTYRGNKLVISFKVTPKEGFLGGNNVYTNDSAGVYENSDASKPVLTFDRPQVNVPIDSVTVTATDKNVYLLGSVTAEQLKEGTTVTVGNGKKAVTLDLTKADENYGLESWQTDYVNIIVVIKDEEGNVVNDKLSNLTDDKTYTIEVKVAPKTTAEEAVSEGTKATTQTGTGTANVNVFTPKLTFKDGEAWYGDDVPTGVNSSLTETKWLHGDDEADTTKMGDPPQLTLSGTPDSTKIADGKINTKQDVPVDVTVKIGETDVTDKTTFIHTPCTSDCSWPETTPDGSPAFLLHVKTCQLTVTKNDGASDEPYVFTVEKDGVKYTEVTIIGNDSETIYELPVGNYTIEEDTGWSWRFDPIYTPKGVALNKDNDDGTITCTNKQQKFYWLNGFSDVVTNIFGKAHN